MIFSLLIKVRSRIKVDLLNLFTVRLP
jgi:hypothetical protein